MVRLKLKISYIGSKFSGWQVQPDKRTVQGCIEEAFKRILQKRVIVYGAGRTDAGVHALGQVAHVDIPEDKTHIPWQKALNSMLPEDISIVDISYVDMAFHARYSAKAKMYSYTLWTTRDYIYPMRSPFCWKTGELNIEKMIDASKLLEGKRDFSCFQNTGTNVKNTIRTIYKIFCLPGLFPEEKVFYFVGDGFLKQMVRNIMGCLYAIGKNRLSLNEFITLISQKDRTLLPFTAPAHGLCLEEVFY